MRPDSSIDTEAFLRIIGIAPVNCLATQHLPLISVDQKRDQGLDFPPHVDRLHQALLYKVNNERIMAPKDVRVLYPNEVDTKADVFSICETAITPPPSPILNNTRSASDSDANILTDEPCLRDAEPSIDNAKQQDTIKVSDRNDTDQQAFQQEPGATYPKIIAEKETANPVVNSQVKDTDQRNRTSPLEIDVGMNADGSFFEDALFVSSEHYQDEDVVMESIASILDQIDSLLMPLPNVPPSDLSHISSEKPTLLSALGWEHHKHLPPLPLNPALEEALPWAPLPPRRRGQFEFEPLAEPCKNTVTQEQDSQIHIGSIGNINDGEIEECPEPEEAAEPQPLPTNALDSLIKLRLQRSASERAPQSMANVSSMPSQDTKPILPKVDDPGATSKLVSAFMSLRGVKAPRSNRKGPREPYHVK
ncbi:hypothetical protein MY11210_004846 [Beauveria gryllotalpidicola]